MTELFERYLALWNEPDDETRRKLIGSVWTEDGRQVLRPPGEVSERAASFGMTASFEARGYAELESRARYAYQEFVAPGEYVFRRRGTPTRLENVARFGWEMVHTGTGEVAGSGLDVLILSGDRIAVDYQFVD